MHECKSHDLRLTDVHELCGCYVCVGRGLLCALQLQFCRLLILLSVVSEILKSLNKGIAHMLSLSLKENMFVIFFITAKLNKQI